MKAASVLLVVAALAIGALAAVMVVSRPAAGPDEHGCAMAVGQKHFLVAIHQRRAPSFQLTWNAPDGAAGYTVYIAKACPSPTCHAPTCVLPDGGPDDGPITVGACNNCNPRGAYNQDADTCTCLNDAGQGTCVNGSIAATDISAGGCANPALCCVTYPGAPAPAGQHDGIIVSRCFQVTDAGAMKDAAVSLYVETPYYLDVEAH